MVKYIVSFSFIFFLFSPSCFAVIKEADLQAQFGRDLTKAPFFLRFSFSKEFSKDWDQSDYAERKVFLKDYETNLANEQLKNRQAARAAAAQERAQMMEQRAEARNERNKLKAQADEAKAEAAAEKDRQKEFDTSLRDQQKELEQLERESARGGVPQGLLQPSEGSDQSSSQGSQGSY